MARPTFVRSVLEHTTNMFQIHTFMVSIHDWAPGLVGIDAETQEVVVFDNPINYNSHAPPSAEWKRYVVAKGDGSWRIAPGDCTGNGCSDIVVSHYMSSFKWLENPGRVDNPGHSEHGTVAGGWVSRKIGHNPSRSFKVGYFTQKDFLEVIAMTSTEWGPNDPIEDAAIFRRPENPLTAENWTVSHFTNERPYRVRQPDAASSFQLPATGLDSWFLTSLQGIHCLYYNGTEMTWEHIAFPSPTPSTACAGRLGVNPAGYILAIETTSDTTVAGFTNSAGPYWVRYEVDKYVRTHGLWGNAPDNFLITADFDGDGDDEALVAAVGLREDEAGLHYYKATNIANGTFSKWKVAEGAISWIAVGDFTAEGKLSFAVLAHTTESGRGVPVIGNPKARHGTMIMTPAIHLYSNTTVPSSTHGPRAGCACNK